MDKKKNAETVLIIGPSGCGKTFLLLNEILEKEKKKCYDFIIILCPTLWINSTYLNWKYLYSDSDVIGLNVNAEKLENILNLIIKTYSGSKTAIIIDDISYSNVQHLNNSMLTYLSYSGRHHNISLFILSQKLNSIATGIRDNTTRLIFFNTHNKRSIKVMKDEFFGYVTDSGKKIIKELAEKKYLDINLNAECDKYIIH